MSIKTTLNKLSLKKNHRQGVAFFPSVDALSGNPYWPMLADELTRKGIILDHAAPAAFNLKYLLSHRRSVKVLNLHFIQQFYKSNTTLKKLVKLVIFLFNMLIARLLGYRTIFTLHNLEPTYQIQPAWLDYMGHWVAVNISERVIVYCDRARELLAQKYGRRNNIYYVDHPNLIQYYPNLISKESARNLLNLPIDSIVFVFIGGVRPNKGIEVLIKAFRKLASDSYRLVIAGQIFPPEWYAESLQEMADGDNRILFSLKRIGDDEMQVFLNAADIVVLPFTRILTSGTANLAMSFARPIIVPKIGCLPELIDENCGWLFQPDDPDSLAEVMQIAASSDPTYYGQKALKKLLSRTADRFAEQTLIAYGI